MVTRNGQTNDIDNIAVRSSVQYVTNSYRHGNINVNVENPIY